MTRWVVGALVCTGFGVVLGAGSPMGQAAPSAELPVVLTSCGQSPGPQRLLFFFRRLDMDHAFLERATADDLVARRAAGTPAGSVLIVTGASLKGMGAAGVSMRDELARTEALIAEARRQGATVICAHVEGMARRGQGASPGDNSDEQSIDAVCPHADLMIVREDGNEDRRFTVISETRQIPLILFEKNMELSDVLVRVFGA
jgi:hypothetical protein